MHATHRPQNLKISKSRIQNSEFRIQTLDLKPRVQNSEFRIQTLDLRPRVQNSEFRIQSSKHHAPEFSIQNSEFRAAQPTRRRAARSTQNSEFRIQDFAMRQALRIQRPRIQSSEFRLGPRQRVHALNQNSEFRIQSLNDVETRKGGRIQSSEFTGGGMGELREEFRDRVQNSE